MSTGIKATFAIDDWDEQEIDEHDDTAKVTRAVVAKTYSGDIDGTSYTEWVMAYAEDGTATFVGVERIRGTIAGRQGTVVLRHVGGFEDGAAKAELTVVAGAGSGDLAGATGSGSFLADPNGSVALDLDLA
jgi:hypothetical protein